MVIGNGLVAKRFGSYNDQDNFLVFASGVSNSKTKNPEPYNREIDLLKECMEKYSNRSLVYFSTCSVDDPQEKASSYVQHKLYIEELIQNHAKRYNIFRVSNLAGKSANPNTVLNYLFHHVKNGINFDLWVNACRNIIDIDHAYLIIDHILTHNLFPNQVINIANPENQTVKSITLSVENFLHIKSNYVEIDKGACFDIDTTLIRGIAQQLGIRFGQEYLEGLLNKYYQHAR